MNFKGLLSKQWWPSRGNISACTWKYPRNPRKCC